MDWIWVLLVDDDEVYSRINWYPNGLVQMELNEKVLALPLGDAMSIVYHELVHYQQDPTGIGEHTGCPSTRNEIMALRAEAEAAHRLGVSEGFRVEIDGHLFEQEMKYRIECEELY
jgi:hypothetical protein